MRSEQEFNRFGFGSESFQTQEEFYKELHSWTRDSAGYSLPMNGEREKTSFWIQGAMYDEETKRPQLIMEESSKNQGAGLDDDKVKLQIVEKLSASMPFPATEIDWFYRDKDGQLHSIDLTSRRELQEHPTITDLRISGDLNRDDFEEARKVFPDQFVNVLSLRVSDVDATQLDRLDMAFAGRANDSLNQVPQQEWDQQVNEPLIDLSKESFQSQLRSQETFVNEHEMGR